MSWVTVFLGVAVTLYSVLCDCSTAFADASEGLGDGEGDVSEKLTGVASARGPGKGGGSQSLRQEQGDGT